MDYVKKNEKGVYHLIKTDLTEFTTVLVLVKLCVL